VLKQGQIERDVYLPSGMDWRDAWSGECFPGGQAVLTQAPLERIPLYLSGDAHLPIQKGS
jgi:alpha-D-xyloside xylohydrolase